MNFLLLLDTNLVEDMIRPKVIKIRFIKELKERLENLYVCVGLYDQYTYEDPWNCNCVDYTSYSLNEDGITYLNDSDEEGYDSEQLLMEKYPKEPHPLSCRDCCFYIEGKDNCIYCRHYHYVKYYFGK